MAYNQPMNYDNQTYPGIDTQYQSPIYGNQYGGNYDTGRSANNMNNNGEITPTSPFSNPEVIYTLMPRKQNMNLRGAASANQEQLLQSSSDLFTSLHQMHAEYPYNFEGVYISGHLNAWKSDSQERQLMPQLFNANPQISQQALRGSKLAKATQTLLNQQKQAGTMLFRQNFIYLIISAIGYISYFVLQSQSESPNYDMVIPYIIQIVIWISKFICMYFGNAKSMLGLCKILIYLQFLMILYTIALIPLGIFTSYPNKTQFAFMQVLITLLSLFRIVMNIFPILNLWESMRRVSVLYKNRPEELLIQPIYAC